MKYFTISLLTLVCFASCMSDDDRSAEATSYYFGVADSVFYSVPDDTVYTDLISESLGLLGVVGQNSLFSETAKIDYNSSYAAAIRCDQQAVETFRKKLNSLSLNQVRNTIYAAHADSLAALGYASGVDIPLHEFSVRFDLMGGQVTTSALDTYTVLLGY